MVNKSVITIATIATLLGTPVAEERIYAQDPAGFEQASPNTGWVRDVFNHDYFGIEDLTREVNSVGITRMEYYDLRTTGYETRSGREERLLNALVVASDLAPRPEFVQRVEEYIGRQATINDIYLIRSIQDSHEIRNIFFDRSALEQEVSSLLRNTNHVDRGDDEGRVYDERPDLSTIDSLNLLRADMTLLAMRNEMVRNQVGGIIYSDLEDSVSEYGGVTYNSFNQG